MGVASEIASGEWQEMSEMTDYRAEWLSDVFIERATWNESCNRRSLPDIQRNVSVAGPGFVWMRFWFQKEEQIFEKYFDSDRLPVGIFAPVSMDFEQHGKKLSAQHLLLSLWIANDGRVTVLGEDAFDKAVNDKSLSPVEIEQAEYRIRELTLGVVGRRFPPALVRNFSILAE